MTSRGPLVAIGGAEEKSKEAAILKRVVALSGLPAPVIAVVTTASAIPDEVFEGYDAAFAALGASEVTHVRVRDRKDAEDERFLAMIRRADVIFISGGDQMRLTNIFGGSTTLEARSEERRVGKECVSTC